MRKVLLSAFLLFYTASIAVRTLERTEAWVTEHASHSKHHSTKASPGGVGKFSPHQTQTKLLEDGWVLVAAFVRSFEPPRSETTFLHPPSGLILGQNGPAASPRAPPSTL